MGYVEPQKAKAHIVIQVLMSDLIEDTTGKFLKVKYIQKKSVSCVSQPYLFDEGSKVCWTPNPAKLTSTDGVALASYDDTWFGEPVSVIEMDGKVDALRSSSMSSRLSLVRGPSSTASSRSRWSRTRRPRVQRMARGSSRRSPRSRSAKLSSRSLLKNCQDSRFMHGFPVLYIMNGPRRTGYLSGEGWPSRVGGPLLCFNSRCSCCWYTSRTAPPHVKIGGIMLRWCILLCPIA